MASLGLSGLGKVYCGFRDLPYWNGRRPGNLLERVPTTTMTASTNILDAVRTYQRWGWSIVPLRANRTPAVKWTEFQKTPATAAQVEEWFSKRYPGVAAILGNVSGGLGCRDFDKADAYKAWAKAHPDLAKVLPTVQTFRGYHVYFTHSVPKTRKFDDGELRGEKSLVVLPPTLHPKGVRYQWIIPPPTDGSIPKVDPWTCGLAGGTEDNQGKGGTEEYEINEEKEVISGSKGLLPVKQIDLTPHLPDIERVVMTTLPQEVGTRDDCLFDLARGLRSLPGLWDIDPVILKPAVKRWHGLALPNIRTKSFEQNWIEFRYKWKRVKYRKGKTMTAVLERMKTCHIEGLDYETPELRDLVKLCCCLHQEQQERGEDVFFLGTPTVERLLSIPRMTAHRYLEFLCDEGWIKLITKGDQRRAGRYRWVGRGATETKSASATS